MKFAFAMLVTLLFAAPLLAQTTDMTPEQNRRALDLFYQIRCPVCDAQPIAESDAGQSADMRNFVRDAVIDGQTDEQILNALAESYGDFIRLNPRKELRTMPLWIAPWVFLFLGFLIVVLRQRAQQKRARE